MFENIGELVVLLWRTLKALPLVLRQRRKVFDQLFEIGNASLLMACVLSLFIGGVIALQTGPVLAERGLASAIGGVFRALRWQKSPPPIFAVFHVGTHAYPTGPPIRALHACSKNYTPPHN